MNAQMMSFMADNPEVGGGDPGAIVPQPTLDGGQNYRGVNPIVPGVPNAYYYIDPSGASWFPGRDLGHDAQPIDTTYDDTGAVQNLKRRSHILPVRGLEMTPPVPTPATTTTGSGLAGLFSAHPLVVIGGLAALLYAFSGSGHATATAKRRVSFSE